MACDSWVKVFSRGIEGGCVCSGTISSQPELIQLNAIVAGFMWLLNTWNVAGLNWDEQKRTEIGENQGRRSPRVYIAGMGEVKDPRALALMLQSAWRSAWAEGEDQDDLIWGLLITGCTVGRWIWQQNVELAEAGGGETSQVGSPAHYTWLLESRRGAGREPDVPWK